jgi:hypothetical protein
MISGLTVQHVAQFEEHQAEQVRLPNLLGRQRVREGYPQKVGNKQPEPVVAVKVPYNLVRAGFDSTEEPPEVHASLDHSGSLCDVLPNASAVESNFDLAEISSSTAASESDFPSSEVRSAYSSIGSELHAIGQCRPCGWFWKPTGCQNGAECLHCHLCPEGEIKIRKIRKVKAQKLLSPDCELPPPLVETDFAVVVTGATDACPLLSVGSAFHGTLTGCRPCAWFHKPGGCTNGDACLHCHLCPAGEIKARKKEKYTAMKQQDEPLDEVDQVEPLSSLTSPLCLLTSPLTSLTSPLQVSLTSPRSEQADLTALPSCGSALHSQGLCKPCGWFWKPGGCQNGESCNHCHACPKDAIAARKRAKAQALQLAPRTGCLASSK